MDTDPQETEAYTPDARLRQLAQLTWQHKVEHVITYVRDLYDRAERPWTITALLMIAVIIATALGG